LKNFFLKVFTWWHGQTFGTQLWTRLYGEYVGTDDFGNKYYRGHGKDKTIGVERRWVIYNGLAEPSKVPPGWHGWLHNTVATPPSEENYRPREWQKPYHPNYTGTDLAYRPPGSTLKSGERPPATGDYQPWTPS
jgi:NADH:ubiquinone oxidoreductase subunit